MGPEQSKVDTSKSVQSPTAKPQNKSPIQAATVSEEYEGIPVITPIIVRSGQKEKYPPDILLPPGELPKTEEMIKAYFHNISFHINKNEEQLSIVIKKQLQEYLELPQRLEGRRQELNKRLNVYLNLFKELDSTVHDASEALEAAIKKADQLATELDPDMAKFSKK